MIFGIIGIPIERGVDIVDNLDCNEEIKTISIKSNQSIAESNLMLLPFVSVQNTNVKILKRTWISNGIERGLVVKGSVDLGVPTTKDLDTLLALFRIMIRNIGFKYEYNVSTNTANFDSPKVNFTFSELAKEMGYNKFSGQIKNIIEKSLNRLNETTIYSTLKGSIRDSEKGEYITEFNGEESFRIICDLKMYSYSRIKASGQKVGNPEFVKENTSLTIHNFFFKNICNNYFKIYDYSKYLELKLGISKKLFLLLNQWSHGHEKYLTYQVMYDMLGLEIKNKTDVYYHNKQIKKAFNELVKAKFIDGFKEKKSKEGVNIIFDAKLTNGAKLLDKYTTDSSVVAKLRELGITYDDITRYYRLDNQDYVRGLLRYYEFQLENNKIVKKENNGIAFLITGLKRENYDLEGFM